MPKIVPIVEGYGDVAAVPILLRRVLYERLQQYTWDVAAPKRAYGLPFLRNHLERYLRYAEMENEAEAILVLLDLEDGCPMIEARQLGYNIRSLSPTLPVAIVFAHREYEAWLLASIETIAQQKGHKYHFKPEFLQAPSVPADVESIRDAKGWISSRMVHGHRYRETIHQPGMTNSIDFTRAAQRSRSFRRFLHAVELLVQHAGQQGFVSP